MKRLVQAVFLAGVLLVFSTWAAEDTPPASKAIQKTKERRIKEQKKERRIKNKRLMKKSLPPTNEENVDEYEYEAETEAEGVGKCPHCGVKTADVEREENTNPIDVAAQISPAKDRKKPTKQPTEGTDAVR